MRVGDPQGQKEIARACQSPVLLSGDSLGCAAERGVPGGDGPEPTEAQHREPPGVLQREELKAAGEQAEDCRGPWDLPPVS